MGMFRCLICHVEVKSEDPQRAWHAHYMTHHYQEDTTK